MSRCKKVKKNLHCPDIVAGNVVFHHPIKIDAGNFPIFCTTLGLFFDKQGCNYSHRITFYKPCTKYNWIEKEPGSGFVCVCGSFFSSSLFLFFDRCTECLHKKIVHQGLLNYKKKYGNESKNNEKTNREKKIVEKIQWLISNAFRKQSFMFEMQTSQLAYSERKEITQLC